MFLDANGQEISFWPNSLEDEQLKEIARQIFEEYVNAVPNQKVGKKYPIFMSACLVNSSQMPKLLKFVKEYREKVCES